MTKKQEKISISPEEFVRHGMLIEQKRRTEIDLAKVIYDTWETDKDQWSIRNYLRILSGYCPTNTYDYYRRLFEIYKYFVIDNQFRPSDLYSLDVGDLYFIKTSRKGLFDKHILREAITCLQDMSLTRKQRKSYIWELKNRKSSLVNSIQRLQKKYDADVVEKFSLMREASKTDVDQTATEN